MNTVTCERCSTQCVDFRQRDGQRVCILCVSSELDEAWSAIAGLRAEIGRLAVARKPKKEAPSPDWGPDRRRAQRGSIEATYLLRMPAELQIRAYHAAKAEGVPLAEWWRRAGRERLERFDLGRPA